MYPMAPYAPFVPLVGLPAPFGGYGYRPGYASPYVRLGAPYAVFGADMDPVAIVRQAWQEVHGEPASDAQAQYVAAIAKFENGFGRTGQFANFAKDGDYNWGSIHVPHTPPCPAGSRQGKDMGSVCFKVFKSDLAAAHYFVWVLTKEPNPGGKKEWDRAKVKAAMNGSPHDVAQAMYDTHYFEGDKKHKTAEQNVNDYAKGIQNALISLGTIPGGGAPAPEPEPSPSTAAATSMIGPASAIGLIALLAAAGGLAYWYFAAGGKQAVAGAPGAAPAGARPA